VIAAGALVLVGLLLSPSTAAAPRQATGACAGNTGVTVVVDFQELGGGTNVVCAPGTPSSGLDALAKAGVSYQTTQRFPGFVCRIAGKPSNDPCVNTSPASAYWAYWLAAPGGSWCYSTLGAGSRRPPPGTFEGWSFALNRTADAIPPPRFAPPPAPAGSTPAALNGNDCPSTPTTLPATTAAPTTTTPTTAAPPTAAASTTASSTTASSTTAASLTDPTTAISTTVISTTATSTTIVSTTTVSAASAADGAASPTTVDLGEDGGGGGSPLAFVVSAAVVTALGAGAFVMARKRAGRTPTSP
jgi:hypothetical protein